MNEKNIDLSIVLPFYNEEGNIKDVYDSAILSLKKYKIRYELIMVNNGSTDNTAQFIKEFERSNRNVRSLHIIKNKGYGYGVLRGMKKARGRYVCYTDGDDPICASYIGQIYKKLQNEQLDICKGRRFVRRESFKRKLISIIYTRLFNLLFMNKIKDINSKPKILKRSCFLNLELNSNDWFIDSEILIKAIKKGYKIGELDVVAQGRNAGNSSVKTRTIFEFIKNLLNYRWKLWTNQKL